jgi:hypothetical protein
MYDTSVTSFLSEMFMNNRIYNLKLLKLSGVLCRHLIVLKGVESLSQLLISELRFADLDLLC